ncbi:hypothetical protein [Taibaiella koreensis]|uniref:hypothetical protein n=1 Tax=Taibaiella koreensis TaxID=1268548 RepID=UPI0013C324A8|nr:hypothetical protein [Taibaiella koreensis]
MAPVFSRWCCILIFLMLYAGIPLPAQNSTPEFPKGFTGYLSLQQGVVSDFKTTPDYYQVGFSLAPQYTVIPSRLRLGAQVAGIYTQGRWGVQAGPTAALRLFDMRAGVFGTVLNVQLTGSHFWGSFGQKLAGGGLQAEIFQLFQLAFTGYRDYGNGQWWLQSSLGFNLIRPKKKTSSDPFNP